MLKATTLVLFFILSFSSAKAEIIKLLQLPLGDQTFFDYSVDLKNECSFAGVDSIIIPSYELAKESNLLLTKVSYFQKKLNLEIDESEITPERITFTLKGSMNLSFEFFFNKSKTTPSCNLVKVIHINNKRYNMDHIEIDYNNFLRTPVVQRFIIKDDNDDSDDIYLYPWQLRGQVSAYELSIGPAISIHTNIRKNNRNSFQKHQPAIEPIPGFFFRYGPIFFNKNGLGTLLYHKGDFSLLGMGLYEGEPYKSPGLQEREQGIFAGFIAKYDYVELTYYNDFLKDKGYNLKFNIAPEFYHGLSWKFTPQVFMQYWDNNYVDYYFGVTPQETVSGLPAYSATHTFNYGTMFEVMHFVNKWTYVLDVGAKFYGKEVYQSPTVINKTELRFIASVLYKVF
jgi:hypothetical protein